MTKKVQFPPILLVLKIVKNIVALEILYNNAAIRPVLFPKSNLPIRYTKITEINEVSKLKVSNRIGVENPIIKEVIACIIW